MIDTVSLPAVDSTHLLIINFPDSIDKYEGLHGAGSYYMAPNDWIHKPRLFGLSHPRTSQFGVAWGNRVKLFTDRRVREGLLLLLKAYGQECHFDRVS